MSKNDDKHQRGEIANRLKQNALTESGSFEQARMAARAREAQELVHEAFRIYGRQQNKDKERELWLQAVDNFNCAISEAYPPGFWKAYEQLKVKDIEGLEIAITFLENDPWFFRSGYVKQELITLICRLPITSKQQKRLASVVFKAIHSRDRREFRMYCKLARRIVSDEMRREIKAIVDGSTGDTGRRAQWVWDAL